MRGNGNIPIYPLGQSQRHFMNKVYQGILFMSSNKYIWLQKKFKFHAWAQWISLLNRRVQKIEQIKPDHCDRYQKNHHKKCN